MKTHDDPAIELALVRKEILSYCEPLPKIIKAHGPQSLGCVALSIGKCLAWIGPTVDRYSLTQPLPGSPPLSVAHVGEELRVIGLDLLDRPQWSGDLHKIVSALVDEVELLKKINGGAK